jgi:hypothetical protein
MANFKTWPLYPLNRWLGGPHSQSKIVGEKEKKKILAPARN